MTPKREDPGELAGIPMGDPVMDSNLLRACARLSLNDTGNGARFKAYFGDRVQWIPRVGWRVLGPQGWKLDEDGIEVRRLAHRVSAMMVGEADCTEPDRQDAHRRFAVVSGDSARIDAMLREASIRMLAPINGPAATKEKVRTLHSEARHG